MKKQFLLICLTSMSLQCHAENAAEDDAPLSPYEASLMQDDKSKTNEASKTESEEPETTVIHQDDKINKAAQDEEHTTQKAQEKTAVENEQKTEQKQEAEHVYAVHALLTEAHKHLDAINPNNHTELVRISQELLEMLEVVKTITVRRTLNFGAWNALVQQEETSRQPEANEREENTAEQDAQNDTE